MLSLRDENHREYPMFIFILRHTINQSTNQTICSCVVHLSKKENNHKKANN